MARRTGTTRNAYRALARIQRKGEERAEELAKDLVRLIAIYAPRDPQHATETGGPALWESYYVRQADDGSFIVACRRRYWAFVEYGTAQHGKPQPHVRPALDEIEARNT